MHALVTGGAGFIGSHLVDALLREGAKVRVLDDFSTGRDENVAHVRDRIDLVRGDICDPAACASAVDGVDVIFHKAAMVSVVKTVEEPRYAHDVNVTGTVNLLEAARLSRVPRFVFAASAAAYGDEPTLPKTELMRPEPISPYGVHKVAGEHYLSVYAKLYGMKTCALRYFNVFGPRQDPKSQYAAVIPRFITAVLAGQAPTIFGDGEQTRDFCYVENVVRANLLAANGDVSGQVLNVALGERVSLNALVATLNELAGKSVKPAYEPPRPGDIKHSAADVTRAREVLGYTPSVDLKTGLQRTMDFFASRG